MAVIKYILEKIDENTVIQHRRLVTPFFYVNLKPRTYTHSTEMLPYLPLPWPIGPVLLKGKKKYKNNVWDESHGRDIPLYLYSELQEVIK